MKEPKFLKENGINSSSDIEDYVDRGNNCGQDLIDLYNYVSYLQKKKGQIMIVFILMGIAIVSVPFLEHYYCGKCDLYYFKFNFNNKKEDK